MLKINAFYSSLASTLRASRPLCFVGRGLAFTFSYNRKKTQKILHSEVEIERMHTTKANKQKKWETLKEPKDDIYKVSLIGLPNSGKSSLFNCMIGERLAIVDKHPGMTRDRKQYDIMEGLVKIIDTPGVEVTALSGKTQQLGIRHDIFKQTVTAIHESNLVIVVIDSTKPITGDQIEMVKYLRKFGNRKIVLACTKAEKMFDESLIQDEISRLGVEKVFVCSGQTGQGIFEILEFINKQVPQEAKQKLKSLKVERTKKFEELVKKLKQQIKAVEQKGINVKQWEYDFRKINPNPQTNPDLDYQNFEDLMTRPQSTFSASRGTQIKNIKMKNTIKICFVGRPNVGKSSLINEILGVDRMVVSDTPHTTRDSIPTKIMYKGRKIELIDTAGLDNHELEKTEEQHIKKAQVSTMVQVKQSHVVVYVMDAFSAFKIEDFKLIRNVVEEGRPILIAVNKWEAIKEQFKYKAKNYLHKQIDENLGHVVHGHPIVYVSAKLNDGVDIMLDNIIGTYDKWNSRISTGMLNDWLDKFKKLDNLPKEGDMTLKINYLLQARVRPPHFVFFVNSRKIFKDNYMRFVTQNIAKEFKMDGIPLRTTLRSTNNKENEKKQKVKNEPHIKKMSMTKQKMEELRKKYKNFGL